MTNNKTFLQLVGLLLAVAFLALSSCDNPFADDDDDKDRDDGRVIVRFNNDSSAERRIGAVALPEGTNVSDEDDLADLADGELLASRYKLRIDASETDDMVLVGYEGDRTAGDIKENPDAPPKVFPGGTRLEIAIWTRPGTDPDTDAGPVDPIVTRSIRIDGDVFVSVSATDFPFLP